MPASYFRVKPWRSGPTRSPKRCCQFLEPGLAVAGELYTLEAVAGWRRFDLASELADTPSF
jgi:hypothetical protein